MGGCFSSRNITLGTEGLQRKEDILQKYGRLESEDGAQFAEEWTSLIAEAPEGKTKKKKSDSQESQTRRTQTEARRDGLWDDAATWGQCKLNACWRRLKDRHLKPKITTFQPDAAEGWVKHRGSVFNTDIWAGQEQLLAEGTQTSSR